jgi:hypothetical protein
MIYTAVFQDNAGKFTFETRVSSHDRNRAWHEAYNQRAEKNSCLVLLIDGQAVCRTYSEVSETPEQDLKLYDDMLVDASDPVFLQEKE